MLRADSVFIIDGHDCEHFDMYRSGAYEAKLEAERQVAYERIMQLLPKKKWGLLTGLHAGLHCNQPSSVRLVFTGKHSCDPQYSATR
jgi:hypothetical protein